jgi:hypothetical protein
MRHVGMVIPPCTMAHDSGVSVSNERSELQQSSISYQAEFHVSLSSDPFDTGENPI